MFFLEGGMLGKEVQTVRCVSLFLSKYIIFVPTIYLILTPNSAVDMNISVNRYVMCQWVLEPMKRFVFPKSTIQISSDELYFAVILFYKMAKSPNGNGSRNH